MLRFVFVLKDNNGHNLGLLPAARLAKNLTQGSSCSRQRAIICSLHYLRIQVPSHQHLGSIPQKSSILISGDSRQQEGYGEQGPSIKTSFQAVTHAPAMARTPALSTFWTGRFLQILGCSVKSRGALQEKGLHVHTSLVVYS